MARNATDMRSSEPDLLDVLDAQDCPSGIHMVLPDFSTACGLGFLEISRIGQVQSTRLWTLTSAETTCPDCLERGDLTALCRYMNEHQQTAEG